MRGIVLAAACMAILHTPEGHELRIEIQHIEAVRPVEHLRGHVAHETGSVVYLSSKNFGVTETVEQVQNAIRNCVNGDKKSAPHGP